MIYIWNESKVDLDSIWTAYYNFYGTCFKIILQSCYSTGTQENEGVIDYFQAAINLHKTVPTYKYLTVSNIISSTTKQYAKSDVLAALKNLAFGHSVDINCEKDEITEFMYLFELKGSLANGLFSPKDSGETGSCGDNVWY